MHGIIFAELQKFVETKHSHATWLQLLTEAGLSAKVYMPYQTYPDGEAVTLVVTAAKMLGAPAMLVMEDFGDFIAADLMNMYRALVKPSWTLLDFLENAEETIHKVVRMKNPGALPPALRVTRTGANTLTMVYSSERKMCGVAKGIIRGAGRHYKTPVTIKETTCMYEGAEHCTIEVRVTQS